MHVEATFGIPPWRMGQLSWLEQMWYEQAAIRQVELTNERWRIGLEAIAKMLGASRDD